MGRRRPDAPALVPWGAIRRVAQLGADGDRVGVALAQPRGDQVVTGDFGEPAQSLGGLPVPGGEEGGGLDDRHAGRIPADRPRNPAALDRAERGYPAAYAN